MSKKNKGDRHGFVYSTDPSFQFESEEQAQQEERDIAAQRLADFSHLLPRPSELQRLIETQNSCRRITASSAQSGSHRDPLIKLDVDSDRQLRAIENR